jgi:hypothetical protein
LLDSPNSASKPRRYAVVLLFKKNFNSNLTLVLDEMSVSSKIKLLLSSKVTHSFKHGISLFVNFFLNFYDKGIASSTVLCTKFE